MVDKRMNITQLCCSSYVSSMTAVQERRCVSRLGACQACALNGAAERAGRVPHALRYRATPQAAVTTIL